MKKPRQLEILAVHVAGGKTIRRAAEIVGISEATAYGFSSSDEFKQAVSRLRTEAVNAAVGSLSDSASEAVDTLRSLLEATNEPSVRLNAAKAILANLKPLSEANELRARIDAIEQQGPKLRVAQ
jgi:hypothetical protein